MKKISKLSIISLLLIICLVFLSACLNAFPNSDPDPDSNEPVPTNPSGDYYIKDPEDQDYSYSAFGQVVNRVIKGCVEIKVTSSFSSSQGSGFIIGKDNNQDYPIIITNYHVVNQKISSPSAAIQIKLGDKASYFNNNNVKVIGYDADMDIAVLILEKSIQDIDDRILTWGNSRAVYKGQEVFAIGNSLGYGISLTQGIVSITEEKLEISDEDTNKTIKKYVIRHSASIISGNSGGPLFNLKGEVIGVNSYGYLGKVIDGNKNHTGGYYSLTNMCLAIPSNLARAICDYVLDNYQNAAVDASAARKVNETLGKNFINCLENIEASLDSQDNNVLRVVNNKLDFLGLQTDDLIIKINGWELNNLFFDSTQICTPSILLELCYYYSTGGSGDALTITVKRKTSGETAIEEINTDYRLKLNLPDWLDDIQNGWID